MIYSIRDINDLVESDNMSESAKSDEFIKTMPKKTPADNKDIDERLADKRFSDWHKMSDKEKREVLNHFNIVADNKRDDKVSGSQSENKYYNAIHNSSAKVRHNRIIPNRARFESTIFESVKFI